MKFVISFFLLLSMQSALANLIVIRANEYGHEAYLLKEAFQALYEIPEDWFLITSSDDTRTGKILDISLNKKGELIEFSKNHKQIIALKILKKKEL